MQNDDRQEELERKIAEAVALAQSVVEDNERESHAENGNTDSPETEAVMTEPGGERKKLLWKVVLGVSLCLKHCLPSGKRKPPPPRSKLG